MSLYIVRIVKAWKIGLNGHINRMRTWLNTNFLVGDTLNNSHFKDWKHLRG
jgi:hypothetical protein